jgi:Cys-rich four helix bundle protein (predicted Tat secretion target)
MTQKMDPTQTDISTDRRNLLIGAGMLGAGALAATAVGTTSFAGEHEHHNHGASPKHASMIAALYACVRTGEACIDHCIDSFKAGDTSLATCAEKVLETGAFCTAHARMASYDSPHLKAMAELGMKICADCEKECLKHEKHALCKACGDACAACIKECKAFLKA